VALCQLVGWRQRQCKLVWLLETAKANGRDPYAYIKQVLTELPAAQTLEDIEALLLVNFQTRESKVA